VSETFVLIHGSWHALWAWHAVIRQLAEKGHRGHAPTLAGHGPNATRLGITHRDCVDVVVPYFHQYELMDVILVGHSFGGSVIQKVVEQFPARIKRLVFLDAFVLEDDQCVFDNLPSDYIAYLINLLRQVLTTRCCCRGKSGATVSSRMLRKRWPARSGRNA